MYRKLRGVLQWLIGETFSLVIAACYGAPMARAVKGSTGAIDRKGSVRVLDPAHSGIGGLQVDVIIPSYSDSGGRLIPASTNSNRNLTAPDGRVFYVYPAGAASIELVIHILEGASNSGGFAATNLRLYGGGQETAVEMKTN